VAGERAVAARRPAVPRPTILVAHPSVDLYGSDRMLLQTVKALADRYQVVVSLPTDGPLAQEFRARAVRVVVRDVPVLRKSLATPLGALRFTAHTLRTLAGMVRLLRRCQARGLYVNTLTVPSWLVAARLARVPALCHVHEAEEASPRLVRTGLAAPLLLARSVVANSEATRSLVVGSVRALRRRTVVVYNGIEPPPADPAPPRARLEQPVRLLLVGRLSPRKGTDLAVDALGLLRDRGIAAHLTLVGSVYPGYEWYESRLRATVDQLGLSAMVDFVGFVDPVWPAHAAADIVLMPSRVEPFGNAAVEAMLAARPLVAGDVQGLREIVVHGKTGLLVRPDDAAALADAVTELVGDWSEACAMAQRGRHEALSRFTLDAYDDQIRSSMDEALAR
jgi:glycosyltransferase involved in cell wall biosynthesis